MYLLRRQFIQSAILYFKIITTESKISLKWSDLWYKTCKAIDLRNFMQAYYIMQTVWINNVKMCLFTFEHWGVAVFKDGVTHEHTQTSAV